MKKDRKNMTIVRYGNMQEAPELTFKTFKDLREHLMCSLAWDNKEDEKDYPLHTFSLKELLSLGDYCIELKWEESH
tara:strand:+ start:227 stop:454 length:228 start_codon:yes stop_codon:yes gene_type:complete